MHPLPFFPWSRSLVGRGIDDGGHVATSVAELDGASLVAQRQVVEVIDPGVAVGEANLAAVSALAGPS